MGVHVFSVDIVEVIGFIGLILVFVSFVVKSWIWLYVFNMSGSTILALYAYLRGDLVFTILEAGIVIFLVRRLVSELRQRGRSRGSGLNIHNA